MNHTEFKSARLALGLTQEQAARLLGYADKSRVSEIERGMRQPTDTIARLLTAYFEGYRPKDWTA